MENKTKRKGRPQGSGNPTLKLTCLVTGQTRATNLKYLDAKAQRLGITVDEIVKNYVSKQGLATLEQFDTTLNKEMLRRINGASRTRTEKVALSRAA
jgi:hypothetical protein